MFDKPTVIGYKTGFVKSVQKMRRENGTNISPAETGPGEIYSFLYSNGQLKAELTVRRTLCPVPEPDALFGI